MDSSHFAYCQNTAYDPHNLNQHNWSHVRPHIHFGTAGYGGLNALSFLQEVLGLEWTEFSQGLEQLCHDGHMTAAEQAQLQHYFEAVQKDPRNEEINEAVTALVGAAFTRVALKHNQQQSNVSSQVQQIVIDYDTRACGQRYAQIIAQQVLRESQGSLQAIVLQGYVSTPMLSDLMRRSYPHAWALHITSSHNPFWYSGFKPEYFGGMPAPEAVTQDIQEMYQLVHQEWSQHAPNFADPQGSMDLAAIQELSVQDLLPQYCKGLLRQLQRCFLVPEDSWQSLAACLFPETSDARLWVDVKWGEAASFWIYAQEQMGQDNPRVRQLLTLLNTTPGGKGLFPHTFEMRKPEPSLANLKELSQHLQEHDMGLANDPDADRTTVILKKSAEARACEVSMNDIAALLLWHVCEQLSQQEPQERSFEHITLATSLASCSLAARVAQHYQAELAVRVVQDLPVGFKWFSHTPQGENLLQSPEKHFVLAFEESGGMSLGGWTMEKDGPLGALAAALLMRTSNSNLLDMKHRMLEALGLQGDYSKTAATVRTELPYLEVQPRLQQTFEKLSVKEAWSATMLSAFQESLQPLAIWAQCSVEDIRIIEVNTQDGLRVSFGLERAATAHREFLEGFVLFRLSGTEPKARIYGEAFKTHLSPCHLDDDRSVLESFVHKAQDFFESRLVADALSSC